MGTGCSELAERVHCLNVCVSFFAGIVVLSRLFQAVRQLRRACTAPRCAVLCYLRAAMEVWGPLYDQQDVAKALAGDDARTVGAVAVGRCLAFLIKQ